MDSKESKGFEETPLDLRQLAALIAMKVKLKHPKEKEKEKEK